MEKDFEEYEGKPLKEIPIPVLKKMYKYYSEQMNKQIFRSVYLDRLAKKQIRRLLYAIKLYLDSVGDKVD